LKAIERQITVPCFFFIIITTIFAIFTLLVKTSPFSSAPFPYMLNGLPPGKFYRSAPAF